MDAQNVDQILEVLATRFGSTGEHLWSVLVRQAYVECFSMIIVILLLLPVVVATAPGIPAKPVPACLG